MDNDSAQLNELRFIITSTMGHECILFYSDMGKLLNALSYQNKGLYNHIRPFALHCISDYNKLLNKNANDNTKSKRAKK